MVSNPVVCTAVRLPITAGASTPSSFWQPVDIVRPDADRDRPAPAGQLADRPIRPLVRPVGDRGVHARGQVGVEARGADRHPGHRADVLQRELPGPRGKHDRLAHLLAGACLVVGLARPAPSRGAWRSPAAARPGPRPLRRGSSGTSGSCSGRRGRDAPPRQGSRLAALCWCASRACRTGSRRPRSSRAGLALIDGAGGDRVGELVEDLVRHRVEVDGQPLALRPVEATRISALKAGL